MFPWTTTIACILCVSHEGLSYDLKYGVSIQPNPTHSPGIACSSTKQSELHAVGGKRHNRSLGIGKGKYFNVFPYSSVSPLIAIQSTDLFQLYCYKFKETKGMCCFGGDKNPGTSNLWQDNLFLPSTYPHPSLISAHSLPHSADPTDLLKSAGPLLVSAVHRMENGGNLEVRNYMCFFNSICDAIKYALQPECWF